MKNLIAFRNLFLSTFLLPFTVIAAPPSDIQNLTGKALDGAVELSWDAATDDGAVLGHKVYYGTTSIEDMKEDEYYDNEVLTDSSDTTYTVEGLSNGIPYYFSVTAIDEEGEESESYSNEVSVTPLSSEVETPSVISAQQISDTEVEVVMSKPIVVKSLTQAFQITEKNNTSVEVPIENIEVDGTYAYVIVQSGSLKPNTTYEITATSAVEDLSGNPVSSGITDSATFTSGVTTGGDIDEDPIVDVNDDFLVDDYGSDGLLEIPDDNSHSVAADTQPPIDVTGLRIDTSKLGSKGIITLTWTPAQDLDGDIADQVLYTKEGNKNWDRGYSLGKNTRTEELSVKKNTNYMVRLVTVDRSGNESNGAVLSFTTNLVRAGASTLYYFIGAVFIAFVVLSFRRKKA